MKQVLLGSLVVVLAGCGGAPPDASTGEPTADPSVGSETPADASDAAGDGGCAGHEGGGPCGQLQLQDDGTPIAGTGGSEEAAAPETPEEGAEGAAARKLGEADIVFEFMLNASRLTGGFAEDLFARRTGLASARLARACVAAQEKGLIERREAGTWHPTALGRRFLNDLQATFLP